MSSLQLQLAAQVKAVNRANEAAIKYADILRKYFSQYVGRKILKADGSLLAKVAEGLLALNLPYERDLSITRDKGRYSLCFEVKTCENYLTEWGDTCLYHHTAIYVGDMSNSEPSVLEKLTLDAESYKGILRTDYTVAEVESLRNQLKVAEFVVSEIQGRLGVFR